MSIDCLMIEDIPEHRPDLGDDVNVARAADLVDAVALMREQEFAVVVLDLGLPSVCRYETVRALQLQLGGAGWPTDDGAYRVGCTYSAGSESDQSIPHSNVPIVAYSYSVGAGNSQLPPLTELWCLSEGVHAAVSKTQPTGTLNRAIDRAARNVYTLSPRAAQWLLDASYDPDQQSEYSGLGLKLKRAERRLLEALADGADVDSCDDESISELAELVRPRFLRDRMKKAVICRLHATTATGAGRLADVDPATIGTYLRDACALAFPRGFQGMFDGAPSLAAAVHSLAANDHVCVYAARISHA